MDKKSIAYVLGDKMLAFAFEIIEIGILLFTFLLATTAFLMALYSVIELRAMKQSTHNVQMVPTDEAGGRSITWGDLEKAQENRKGKEAEDDFSKDFDNVI